jgi:hypothetical protein
MAKGLLTFLEELRLLNVGFISLRERFDLATPAGRLMAGMLARVAAYETKVRKGKADPATAWREDARGRHCVVYWKLPNAIARDHRGDELDGEKG